MNEVKETIEVTVIQKHKEKKLQESEAKVVIDIIDKAEKQEITGNFGEPEYEIQISRDGKKETYYAWLRGEDRRGWVQHKKAMYMLNKKIQKSFWLYFQMYQNKKKMKHRQSFNGSNKKICRLPRSILKRAIKK